MLIVAMVAVAIPYAVQAANPNFQWCQDRFPRECFDIKAECKKAKPPGNCIKEPRKSLKVKGNA